MPRQPNPYERPRDAWTCGNPEDPCNPGPGGLSSCGGAEGDCRPQKEGDRWRCARSSALGGPCDLGPTPEGLCRNARTACAPRRNLRSLRGVVVLAISATFLGMVTFLLATPARNEFLAPGPLSSAHGQILQGEQRCEACHAAAKQHPSEWFANLASESDHSSATQSQLCLNCHAETLATDHALLPHGAAPDDLAKRTAEAKQRGGGHLQLASWIGGVDPQEEIGCAACHREHHGREADLAALTDAQCQSCHAAQFTSFTHGHPEFDHWPPIKRGGGEFDHAAHEEKHFATTGRTFECKACHVIDSQGAATRVLGYEQTCASCHDAMLVAASGEGLKLLRTPVIDVPALSAAGIEAPPWPIEMSDDFDGAIAPWMRALLAADGEAAAALDNLGWDFAAVDWEDDESLRHAGVAARCIERLMTDVGEQGPTAIAERLSRTLGVEVTTKDATGLFHGLPAGLLAAVAKSHAREAAAGYTHQAEELERKTIEPETTSDVYNPSNETTEPESSSQPDATHTNPESGASESIIPRRFNPLREPSEPSPQPDAPSLEKAPEDWLLESPEEFHLSPDDERKLQEIRQRLDARTAFRSARFVSQGAESLLAPGAHLLSAEEEKRLVEIAERLRGDRGETFDNAEPNGGAPLKSDSEPDSTVVKAEEPNSTIFAGEDGDDSRGEPESIGNQPVLQIAEEHQNEVELETLASDVEHQAVDFAVHSVGVTLSDLGSQPPMHGGWYVDAGKRSLAYAPKGHADPVLKRWLELLASANRLDDEILTPPAAQTCLTCHQPTQAGGAKKIVWRYNHDASERSTVKFSHLPHVTLPQLANCRSCHQTKGDNSLHLVTHGASLGERDFKPLKKSDCAACHTPQGAGDSCQQCHHYHWRRDEAEGR